MPVYKTRTFARWMKREGLVDQDLRDAIMEMQTGLVDARLGGGLVKKRVARPGQGRRNAPAFLGMNEAVLRDALTAGELMEIKYGQ